MWEVEQLQNGQSYSNNGATATHTYKLSLLLHIYIYICVNIFIFAGRTPYTWLVKQKCSTYKHVYTLWFSQLEADIHFNSAR